MIKQAIASILILVIIATSTFASPIFSFSKLFENVKRAPTDSNICCLPNAFSLKGSFNQVSLLNGTMISAEGGFNLAVDYNNGKLRQDVFATADGTNSKYTNWDFRISSSVTVSYDLKDGKCSCRKVTSFNQWNPICVPSPTSGTITKAKFGAYDALKIVNSQYGATGTLWTFREPQMASDKCWILNSFAVVSSAAQEQIFSDMVEKVDGSAFNVPSQCPSMNTCLAQ